MSAEVGQFALILALLLALVQSAAPLWGAHRRDAVLMSAGRAAARLQAGFVVLAFVCLAYAYVTCDFSVALVANTSNTAQPLAYRFAATWGSHEGSMLLWVLILAVFGAGVAWFGGTLRETLQARVLGVQGLLGSAFLGFLLFTSNPFLRLSPAAAEGQELNPLLQDPGLVFHPPVLYLGYVGYSMAFCFAVAALIEGRVDAAWARWVRPWVLAAWIPLTLGITFGSAWAYYELGWGGWWFWDPVENASVMPWLLGTALLHSALVLERRGALVSWTILLAILTFTFSLIGTFLVRSGILTSVHAFAVDPRRGVYVLGIIGITTGASLALYAWRAQAIRPGALFQPMSREGGMILNNVFLATLCAAVFAGTFSPVFIEMVNGDKISVGPPYYARTFVPIAALLLIAVVFGPMLNWKRDAAMQAVRRLRIPLIAASLIAVVALALGGLKGVVTAGGLALAAWLVLGSAAILLRRWWAQRNYLARAVRTTPRAMIGLTLAHLGLGLMVLGITGVTAWESDKVVNMRPGDTVAFAGRTLTLSAVETVNGPNYEARRASILVRGQGAPFTLSSERRFFPSARSQTTEAGIHVRPQGNLYISIGEESAAGVVIRMWDHPLIVWIWLGGITMAAGGAVSLSDRRLRLGAAVKTAAAPTPQAVAAE